MAAWSWGLTVAVPLIWACGITALSGMGEKNAALGLGWIGVLPVLLFVPVGVIVSLILLIGYLQRARDSPAVPPPATAAPPTPDQSV